jgi:hypothetical protein
MVCALQSASMGESSGAVLESSTFVAVLVTLQPFRCFLDARNHRCDGCAKKTRSCGHRFANRTNKRL